MPALAVRDYPYWPAGMNRETALAYTGVSSEQLKAWERTGKVQFRARGPRGAHLALRGDLDKALAGLFVGMADDEGPIDF